MNRHLWLWLGIATAGCNSAPCPRDDAGLICTIAGTGVAGFVGEGERSNVLDAMFYAPMDVAAIPGTDDYLVTDWNNHRIRRADKDGTIRTVMGTELPGDGPEDLSDRDEPGADGTTVALNHPVQVEVGPDGFVYLPAWHNHKVRVLDLDTGLVVVIAGDTSLDDGNGANAGFAGDGGPADDALLAFPTSIAFAPDDSWWLLDAKNLRIRTVDAAGMINTTIGTGEFGFDSANTALASAKFKFVDDPANPQPMPGGALESDADGHLYIADSWNHSIWKCDAEAGTIALVAGTGTAGYTGDGGQASAALLDTPKDIEFGPDGRLYVADTGNHVIRAIDLDTGTIETVAGDGTEDVGEEAVAPTASALSSPHGIDFAGDGALLIADTYNHRIRRVNP